MLNFVYERLVLLVNEANYYIFKENKLNIEEVEKSVESMKIFISKLKDAFKELPEALDEVLWLEMVVENEEEKQSNQQQMTVVEQEKQ